MNGITNLKGGKNKDQKIRPSSQKQGSNDDKRVEWVTSKTLRVQLLEFKYLQLCLLNVQVTSSPPPASASSFIYTMKMIIIVITSSGCVRIQWVHMHRALE